MAGLIAVSIGLGAEKLGRTISEKRLERKEKKAVAVCPQLHKNSVGQYAHYMYLATGSDVWFFVIRPDTAHDHARATKQDGQEARGGSTPAEGNVEGATGRGEL
jgi:hypothetical protein